MEANLGYAADAKEFNLKVVDEQGKPVAKFEALIYSGTGLRWAAGKRRRIALDRTASAGGSSDRRADGYASTTQQFTGN